MSKSVNRSDKVVFRLGGCIAHDKFVEDFVVRICKEYRLYIGVVHPYVLHPVLLLVTACKLMLLDDTCHIVVNKCSNNKSVLSLAVHGLCIDIVLLL